MQLNSPAAIQPNLSPGPVQGEFHLNDVQNGVLPAAFLLGLLVASVAYSELAKTYNAFRLIGAPAQHQGHSAPRPKLS